MPMQYMVLRCIGFSWLLFGIIVILTGQFKQCVILYYHIRLNTCFSRMYELHGLICVFTN